MLQRINAFLVFHKLQHVVQRQGLLYIQSSCGCFCAQHWFVIYVQDVLYKRTPMDNRGVMTNAAQKMPFVHQPEEQPRALQPALQVTVSGMFHARQHLIRLLIMLAANLTSTAM